MNQPIKPNFQPHHSIFSKLSVFTMVTKRKEKKKNKGPKGKKARAQAKLHRQWGEQEIDEKARYTRGQHYVKPQKQRLDLHTTNRPATTTTRRVRFQQETESNENDVASKVAAAAAIYSASDESDEDDSKPTVSLLLQSIQRRRGKKSRNNDSEDESIGEGYEDKEKQAVQETIPDDSDLEMESMSNDIVNIPNFFRERFVTTSLVEASAAADSAEIKTLSGEATPLSTTSISYDIRLSANLHGELESLLRPPATPTDSSHGMASIAAQNRRRWSRFSHAYFRTQVRPLLHGYWSWSASQPPRLSPTQSFLLPFLASYSDILWTIPPVQKKTSTTAASRPDGNEVTQIVSCHLLNHVITSRNLVHGNTKKLAAIDAMNENDDDKLNDQGRDQGYTRPLVLVLLPTRGTCHAYIHALLQQVGMDSSEMGKMNRFEAEYGPPPPEEEDHEAAASAEAARVEMEHYRRRVLAQKGAEWLELFGDQVNTDDDFKIGISINPKKKKRKANENGNEVDYESGALNHASNCDIRLYTDFYKSDIIFASPLGLKMLLSSEDKDNDYDYLSSIEICYVALADVLLMQNYDHVLDIFKLLNQQPKNSNDTDFSRVRPYMLAGQGKYRRQLIVQGGIMDPLILSSFKQHAHSSAGSVQVRQKFDGNVTYAISQVLLPTRQVFQRITGCKSFQTQSTDRLSYFMNRVLPTLVSHTQKHTLIFIPSYFDFVLVRNALLKYQKEHELSEHNIAFVSVTEYSRVSETSRARARFLQGHHKASVMLYTGRAHYFLRHVMKGARHVIFYSVPEYPAFYADHVNRLNLGISASNSLSDDPAKPLDDSTTSALTLYTQYEAYALERIVGTSNCRKLLRGDQSTFLFS
jgi:U3 small nucleolar RNA-associated protein 25